VPAVQEYIANYKEAEAAQIAFAWNGKHAADFKDANQDFRWQVAAHCIQHPDAASPELLAALFRADAEWAREAWCSPGHFPQLASTLLVRGGESVLNTFVDGLYASFDTYGACHRMELPRYQLIILSETLQTRIPQCTDPQRKKQLTGALELFDKLERGVASEGWVHLPPGTPVKKIRVVWPRWYHRVWRRIKSWFG